MARKRRMERYDGYEVSPVLIQFDPVFGESVSVIPSEDMSDAAKHLEPGAKLLRTCWGLYGRVDKDAQCIGDFNTQDDAFEVLYAISGIRGKEGQTHYTLPKTITRTMELETFYDLCFSCGYDLHKTGKLLHEDSRSVMDTLIRWANEFNEKNKDREWDGEYMEEVEDFFYEMKRKEFGD